MISKSTMWIKPMSFPKSYLPIGPNIGESMYAYLFYIDLSFCWYSVHSEDEQKYILASKHCDNDNTLCGAPRHAVGKISGSRTMSKVSAADATWDESWGVADGEWHRKSKGGFTRVVVSPNKETNLQTDLLSFHCSQCSVSSGRELHFWGESLGFRQSAFSWQWEVHSYCLLFLLLSATHHVHWFGLLVITQERFCTETYSLSV